MKARRQPFQVGGVVAGAFFTDRAAEVARIATALRSPGERLLVYGPRRMGKTSAIHAAVQRVQRGGVRVVVADLSTVSTAADAANRVAAAVARALGRGWKDVVAEFVSRIGVQLTLRPDATGLLLPSLEVSLQRAAASDQLAVLGRTLDAVNALSTTRATPLALVLDEFQELSRIGGAEAEWQLRGHMQHHRSLSYVVAGSQEHLIRRMLERDRAFYKMFDVLRFDAMDPGHLGRWIDDRLRSADVTVAGVGDRIVRLAGPRTQDVLQLARKTLEVVQPGETAGERQVVEALEQIVRAEGDLIRALWEDLTPLQQNVLRAVAVDGAGLTRGETIERFALGSTGSATNAARALIEKGILLRAEAGPAYAFDSPFVRGWVLLEAVPDAGWEAEFPWRTD